MEITYRNDQEALDHGVCAQRQRRIGATYRLGYVRKQRPEGIQYGIREEGWKYTMKRHACCLLLTVCLFYAGALFTPAAQADGESDNAKAGQLWFVDADNISGIENGLNWATAFTSIQVAVDAAAAGDSVWVAEGTYTSTTDPVVTMKEGVALYGGFAGTETVLENRDYNTYVTIVDGQDARRCVTAATAKLDGFTVRNGRTYGELTCVGEPLCHYAGTGAAVNALSVAPEIRNCIFVDNHTDSGAAVEVAMNPAPVTVANCRFFDNEGSLLAGTYHAGGAFAYATTLEYGVTLESCEFVNNHSQTDGAAFYGYGTISVTDCFFKNNRSENLVAAGGAIWVEANTLFERCIFDGNEAATQGGAIYVYRCDTFAMRNCLFVENHAAQGGAIAIKNVSQPSIAIANCTMTGNVSTGEGAVIYCTNNYSANLSNCIVWNNTGTSILDDTIATTPISVDYSCVQGGFAGTGNVNADPLFHAPAANNYSLETGSPCIDTADDVQAPTDDLLGRVRPLGSHADMGALEHDPTGTILFPDVNLEAAIREAIGKPSGPIYDTDLDSLETLLANGRDIAQLGGLEYCVNLRHLELAGNRLIDISPISNLTSLETLNLGDWDYPRTNWVADINPLKNLDNLVTVKLIGNPIVDVSVLVGKNNLGYLELAESGILDLGPLVTLPALHNLGINNCRSIGDFSPLAEIEGLRYLSCAACNITSVSWLAECDNLVWVALQINNITDITPVQNNPSLLSIELDTNPLTDIAPLATIPSLTVVSLAFTQVVNVQPLASLVDLKVLILSHSPVADIQSLSGLHSLQVLGLGFTNVPNLQPISALQGLWWLEVSGLSLGTLQDVPVMIAGGLGEDYGWVHYSVDLITEYRPGDPPALVLNASSNDIAELGSLLSHDELGSGTSIDLHNNPLTQDALCEQIPVLRERGVHVAVDTECPEIPGVAYYRELLTTQMNSAFETFSELLGGADPETADLDGDGIPDSWMLNLVATTLGMPGSRWHEATQACYEHNIVALESTNPSSANAAYMELYAALILSSEAMRDIASVMGNYPEGFDPIASFCIVNDETKNPLESFSGAGDYDGDGVTNYEEYWNVCQQGGDRNRYLTVVMDPNQDGSEPMSVSATLGLVLLTLALCIVGTLGRRRLQGVRRIITGCLVFAVAVFLAAGCGNHPAKPAPSGGAAVNEPQPPVQEVAPSSDTISSAPVADTPATDSSPSVANSVKPKEIVIDAANSEVLEYSLQRMFAELPEEESKALHKALDAFDDKVKKAYPDEPFSVVGTREFKRFHGMNATQLVTALSNAEVSGETP